MGNHSKNELRIKFYELAQHHWESKDTYFRVWKEINLFPDKMKCIAIIKLMKNTEAISEGLAFEKNINDIIAQKAANPDIFYLEYIFNQRIVLFALYSDIQELTDLIADFCDGSGIDYRIGISNPFMEVDYFSTSIMDATGTLQKTNEENKIQFFANESNIRTGMDVNSSFNDAVAKLIEALESGKNDGIQSVLNSIYESFKDGNPNIAMDACLGILNKIANHFELYSRTNFYIKYRFDLFHDQNQIMYAIRSVLFDNFFKISKIVSFLKAEGSLDNTKARKVMQITEQSYSNPLFSLSDIADMLCVSYSYLSSVFKTQTGTNFSKYLTSIRMLKARDLLETTDAKISSISNEVGFSDTGYFITVFRKYYQLSPGEYREKLNRAAPGT